MATYNSTAIRRQRFFQVQRAQVRRAGTIGFVAGVCVGAFVVLATLLAGGL